MSTRDLWALAVVALVIVAGCTRRLPSPEGYDSLEARDVLVTALDAWKRRDLKSLVSRAPPIRFVDDDERAGLQLADYAFGDKAATDLGRFEGFDVNLTLKNRQGETITRAASYQVSLDPLAVLRSDP
ncbi:MAG: hypothetical protein KF774_16495 [Planctomyces sp.]|nr:hypothetical protein [Planctomyces sp.]